MKFLIHEKENQGLKVKCSILLKFLKHEKDNQCLKVKCLTLFKLCGPMTAEIWLKYFPCENDILS